MRATGLCALVLAVIPAALGCGDDPKFPDPGVPDPALNGVFPDSGFTSRTIRVEISGDGTELTSAPTVAFGAGITVSGVELASPSDLFATITIAGDAAVGKRDVTVTDGAGSLTLALAFEVKVPLEIFTAGEVEQGGIASLLIVNHDPETPFLGDLAVTAGNGTTFVVDTTKSTEFKLFATVFLDTDANTGALTVTDSLGTTTVTSQGAALAVTARTATPLAPPVGGTIDLTATATLTHATGLFSFTATSAIWRGTVAQNDNVDAFPLVIWLKDGKWANARGFAPDDLVPTTASTMSVVVLDRGFFTGDPFPTGYSFTLDADEFTPLPTVTNVAEVEPNDPLIGTAQTLAGAQTLFTGTLLDFGDFDFLKVTLTLGQTIRATTTMGVLGVADTDVRILLCSAACGSADQFTFIAGSNDANVVGRAEDVQTGPLAAGNYVVLLESSFNANPVDVPYEAAVVIGNAAAFANSFGQEQVSQTHLVGGAGTPRHWRVY